MDAPRTQYRVIERDGRLIVLETGTNLRPKQARELTPVRTPPPSPSQAPNPPAEPVKAAAPSLATPETEPVLEAAPDQDELENIRWDDPPGGLADFPLSLQTILGIAFAAILLGTMIGGSFGFFLAAAAIVGAGRYALRPGGFGKR